jgi:membrane protease YdiL (CAAX protease family)
MRWEVPSAAYFHFLPQTGAERLAFVALSLIAGFAEEYAIRGFCLGNLSTATGSLLLAAAITTVGFGLGHAYQGFSGTIRTTLAADNPVVPVMTSGFLLPSMLAHATLDVLSGLGTLPLLSAWGVLPRDRTAASAPE